MEIDEGDYVVMLYDYSHTKMKGQLAEVTGLHLKDVSVLFTDGMSGSYRWNDVRKASETEVRLHLEVIALKKQMETIGGMAGNPDAKEGCRLICKRVNKVLGK